MSARSELQQRVAQKGLNYIEIGDGWIPLVTQLLDDLDAINPDFEIHQIKEKFGGLRFYTGLVNDEQMELIRVAEEKSFTICEVCGGPGEPGTKRYWIRTLCEDDRRIS